MGAGEGFGGGVVAQIGVIGSGVIAWLTAHLTTRRDFERLRGERSFEYPLEDAIRHLLENPVCQKRSLRKLKRHPRGFGKDDGRRLALIRAGTVAFGGEGEEGMRGLPDRHREEAKRGRISCGQGIAPRCARRSGRIAGAIRPQRGSSPSRSPRYFGQMKEPGRDWY